MSDRGATLYDRARAEERYEHGTFARYCLAKCRCEPCKKAAREYERNRRAERRQTWQIRYAAKMGYFVVKNMDTGEIVFRTPNRPAALRRCAALNEEEYIPPDRELIPADEAREHIAWLQENGLGLQTVARCSGVAYSVIERISSGNIKNTRRETAEKILSVGKSDISGGAHVDAAPTKVLLGRLVDAGYRKGWIAQQLGAKSRALIGRRANTVSVRNARKVHELYVRLSQGDKRLPWIDPVFAVPEAESSFERGGYPRRNSDEAAA